MGLAPTCLCCLNAANGRNSNAEIATATRASHSFAAVPAPFSP